MIHSKELKRTTNTGRLACHALINSELRTRGDQDRPLDLSDLLEAPYRTLLFYPCEDAVELTPEFIREDPRPIQLIVPDGNWRQASKVHYRQKELQAIPRVMIKTPNLSAAHLRAESTPEGMATLQAIAMAYQLIEGEVVGQALMALYNEKLKRTLIGRGQIQN